MGVGGLMPYIYIDKIFNELRAEMLSAMHSAVEREVRNGQVDVQRLLRSFTRAAAGKCASPVRVSEKGVAEGGVVTRDFRPKERGEDSVVFGGGGSNCGGYPPPPCFGQSIVSIGVRSGHRFWVWFWLGGYGCFGGWICQVSADKFRAAWRLSGEYRWE